MQDGLTTNVSMFVRSLCVLLGTLVILFTYSPGLACIIVLCILPAAIASRFTAGLLNIISVRYQKAKADVSNIATENISNVRTVKAFGNEDDASLKF